jgi:serine palmitoyltransferase
MCGIIIYFGFKLTSKIVNPLIIILVLFGYLILKTMFSKKKKEKKKEFDKNEVLKKLENWSPAPLAPYIDCVDETPIVSGTTETHLQINNKKILNLGSYNMLGFLSSSEIKKASENVIKKFRVGSCGPRVFLGTLSEHVDLETRAAKFFGTEASTLYPFGYCTISSAIPAFSSKKDIFIVDEGVNFSIQTGFILAKAKPIYFKHNDVKDLERILESVRNKKQPKFVIVEGLYEKYGDIAPVTEIAKLKEKYNFWWFLDDSYGVGVLGKTGRGTLEYCGVPISKVDVFCSNLETSFATMGGLVCGDKLMCEFQRMSSTGYLYSASSPAFTACAGRCAMDELDKNPQLLEQLKRNIQFIRKALHPLKLNEFQDSPIIHISVESNKRAKEIAKSLLERGIAIVAPKYSSAEYAQPPPSIRLVVNAKHSTEELGFAAKIIKEQILE